MPVTEHEWLTGNNPYPMFAAIRRTENTRRMRLFGCGCCRQVWELLVDERSRDALRLLEEDADDETDSEPWIAHAHDFAYAARSELHARTDGTSEAACTVCDVVQRSPLEFLFSNLRDSLMKARGLNQTVVQRIETDLLRDIFGNPFRPVSINFSWLTFDVRTLAEGIYSDRAFDRMPILADALQGAGCDNDDILSHCRSDAPHVRGCWVVDLVLGKS